METLLRGALLSWLRADPALAALNSITEEAPLAATAPWLGIVASASADWSVKTRLGREIRIALELHCRGDDPSSAGEFARALDARIDAIPRIQAGFEIASSLFLRARAERRANNIRAVLAEYRFRVLEAA
jgi:hypothetical protein